MLTRSHIKNNDNMFIVSLNYKMENDIKRNTIICITEIQLKKIQFKTIILYHNGIYGKAELIDFISRPFDIQLMKFLNFNKKFIFNSIEDELIDDVVSEMTSKNDCYKDYEFANILLSIKNN
jgi:hypothetical protein